jgi:predicted ATPase
MRISKCNITSENTFSEYLVEFMNSNKEMQPTIHFMVGNNGAGKTILMQSIYALLTKNSTELKTSISGELNFLHNQQQGRIDGKITINSGGGSSFTPLNAIVNGKAIEIDRKSVFSTVEINFQKEAISSVTASAADSPNPTEVSKNLNKSIPQLLVDVKSQDDSVRSIWMRDNIGSPAPEVVNGEKFYRFENAFNSMFNGTKKFLGITKEDNEFKIKFKDISNDKTVDLSSLSTGEKQIIYRLGFILKNIESTKDALIFIDEPEIGLHPKWQMKFKHLLKEQFKNSEAQIIISTHSPYIIGELDPESEEALLIEKSEKAAHKLSFPKSTSTSLALITYLAYQVPTIDLHNQLFEKITTIAGGEIGKTEPTITDVNNWLSNTKHLPQKNRNNNPSITTFGNRSSNETAPVWIRNKIHHPDNTDRITFSENDLKQSIDLMLGLI